MKLFLLKREWILWVIILLPLILYFFLAAKLPAQIPSHYNINGQADAYMSPVKFLLDIIPVNALLYGVLLVLPQIDPRKKNYFLFSKAYYGIRLAVHLMLSAIFAISILSAAGWKMNVTRLISLCVMMLFVLLGNYLTRVRPNWFVGIRTPWTLDNETVWRKTHLVGGRLMFALGLIGMVLVLVLPVNTGGKILLPVVLISVMVPVIYSYMLYRKIKSGQSDQAPS